MTTVTLHSLNHATVHYEPSWFARVILGRRETARPANRVRIPGGYTWVYFDDNRDVSERVRVELERRRDQMAWRAELEAYLQRR